MKMIIRRTLLVLPLSTALLVSTSLLAQDHDRDRDDRHDNRHHVYDRRHKDYHDFDDREERGWQTYWQQRHHPAVDWDRASDRQRQAYWNWRHTHSDDALGADRR